MTVCWNSWIHLLKDWRKTVWTCFTFMLQITIHPLKKLLKLSISFIKVCVYMIHYQVEARRLLFICKVQNLTCPQSFTWFSQSLLFSFSGKKKTKRGSVHRAGSFVHEWLDVMGQHVFLRVLPRFLLNAISNLIYFCCCCFRGKI